MPVGVTIELGLGSLLVYGLPFIIVVGWFSSRLLGVHRGWGRSLVAGFFGWVGGVAVAAVIENHDVRTTGQLEDIRHFQASPGHAPGRGARSERRWGVGSRVFRDQLESDAALGGASSPLPRHDWR